MKILSLIVIMLVAVAAFPQSTSTVPAPPTLTPFDPTPVIVAVGQNTDWTKWAQTSIIAVGTKVDLLTNQESQIQALQTQLGADEDRIAALERKLAAVATKVTNAGTTLATP